jgi:hypothetical protein
LSLFRASLLTTGQKPTLAKVMQRFRRARYGKIAVV